MIARKQKKTSSRKHRRRHHHFLAAWMRSPLKMGALVPSSRALARAMAAQVDLKLPGPIVELGAGTGVVTHALLEAGIPSERLLIVERDALLHKGLAAHFPDLKIICADAIYLEQVLQSQAVARVNAIVSSLPLLSMPRVIRKTIEQSLINMIASGGMLVQFTYGPRSPIAMAVLRKNGLSGKRVKTVLTNVPPAHIWVYKKTSL